MLSTMSNTTTEAPVETEKLPREFNPNAPCRLSSAESDMRGECMRCGSKAGEPCAMYSRE